jgi:hypothetical protein
VSNARGALQSFRCCCSAGGVTTSSRPRRIGCPFRVSRPLKYGPYRLGHSALPLALSSAVRLSLQRGSAGDCSVSSRVLSWGLASGSSFAQQYLVSRPQSADPSLGLLFPSAHQGSKVHFSRAQPARYVPPSGFGHPLDGFLPSVPCRFFFTPAALLGFTLRSFLLSKGIRGVTTRMSPPAVSPIGIPAAVAVGRPNRPRLLGFNPSESP